MNDDSAEVSSPLTIVRLERLHGVCTTFERQWKAGAVPVIEEYLAGFEGNERTELLRELLQMELEYRRNAGEDLPLQEFEQRFSNDAAIVRDVFGRLGLLPHHWLRVKLSVISGPHIGREFAFEEHDTFVVGRSRRARFRLPREDQFFSRFHFMVEVNPPLCRLTDLNSTNGTKVNSTDVTSVELADGDLIEAGETTLRVEITGSQPSSLEPTVLWAEMASHAGDDPDSLHKALQPFGYRIVEKIGQGGMGVVYRAVRETDGSQVALKTIRPAVAGARTDIDRFLREASILRELRHPNIVGYRDVGEFSGLICFAMDYVPGIDVQRLIRNQQGPFRIARAVRLACQALEALQYAHERGFVHRDIKPANLIVDMTAGSETIKLTDFGLARVYQTSRLSGLTIMGDVGGTARYMAPEQITDFRNVLPAADQYAAAATLYHVLTKRHTHNFNDEDPAADLLMTLQEDPVPIRQRRDDIPPPLAFAIHRALSRDPQDRFADVAEFRASLLPFANP